MNEADRSSSAACSQIGFGCRGSDRGDAVAQVGARAVAPASTAARIVRAVGGGVAQRHDHAARDRLADELDRAGPLRGEGDQDDPAARGLLELLEQLPVRVADGMRPGAPRGNRPAPRGTDLPGGCRRPCAATSGKRSQAAAIVLRPCSEVRDRRRDQGRAEPGRAEGRLGPDDLGHLVDGQVGAGERVSPPAVDLDVPEGRRDPVVIGMDRRRDHRPPRCEAIRPSPDLQLDPAPIDGSAAR